MANKSVHLPMLPSGLGGTLRRDSWWVGPAITFTILCGFIVFATFRSFENDHFQVGPNLSPLYSPLIDTSWAKGWPIPVSGAMLNLAGPGWFRFTCYCYRMAYYRAFAFDPPACAVGESRKHNYNGERKLLIFQNLHRFTLYVAIAFLVFLWRDAIHALAGWKDGLHLNVGTLVITMNATLLSGYTLSCHAFRHLLGGNVNSYSTATAGMFRYKLWKLISKLNSKHMVGAWCSLFGVALTDLYIRSVATGAITDVRIFGCRRLATWTKLTSSTSMTSSSSEQAAPTAVTGPANLGRGSHRRPIASRTKLSPSSADIAPSSDPPCSEALPVNLPRLGAFRRVGARWNPLCLLANPVIAS